jgi:hypothetical protein
MSEQKLSIFIDEKNIQELRVKESLMFPEAEK